MELIFSFVDDYEMYPSYHPYSSKTQKDYQKVLFVFLISLDVVLPPPTFSVFDLLGPDCPDKLSEISRIQ